MDTFGEMLKGRGEEWRVVAHTHATLPPKNMQNNDCHEALSLDALNQCGQIGLFGKVSVTIFVGKVVIMFGDMLGCFEIRHFLSKNYYGYFLNTF